MAIIIPKGKKIKISVGGKRIDNDNFALASDFSITLSSQFESLVGGGSSKFFTALGGVLRDISGFSFSGQFKELGYQIWTGTDPVSLSFEVHLFMKTNTYEDVVKPARELLKLPLPDDAGFDPETGVGLVPPGPSLLEVFNAGGKSGSAGGEGREGGKNVSVKIGNLYLPKCIVTKAEPTVTGEGDDKGNPLWIKIRVDIQTIFSATTNLIDNWFWSDEASKKLL